MFVFLYNFSTFENLFSDTSKLYRYKNILLMRRCSCKGDRWSPCRAIGLDNRVVTKNVLLWHKKFYKIILLLISCFPSLHHYFENENIALKVLKRFQICQNFGNYLFEMIFIVIFMSYNVLRLTWWQTAEEKLSIYQYHIQKH